MHHSYRDVINNKDHYVDNITDHLIDTKYGQMTYETFQIFSYITIKNLINANVVTRKCIFILLPGCLSTQLETSLLQPDVYRNYLNTEDEFILEAETCKTIKLSILLKKEEIPIYLMTPVVSEDNFCTSLMICDVKLKTSWSWEPYTHIDGAYDNLRSIFIHENAVDETRISLFNNKKLLVHYLFNNFIVRKFEGQSMNNMFLSMIRLKSEKVNITKYLSTDDSICRFFILPFIIHSFIDNLVGLRGIPQDSNDIHKILIKLVKRQKSLDFIAFTYDKLKHYDIMRLEKNNNGDSEEIKFYPLPIQRIQLQEDIVPLLPTGGCPVAVSFKAIPITEKMTGTDIINTNISLNPIASINQSVNLSVNTLTTNICKDDDTSTVTTKGVNFSSNVRTSDKRNRKIINNSSFDIDVTIELLRQYYVDACDNVKTTSFLDDGDIKILYSIMEFEKHKALELIKSCLNKSPVKPSLQYALFFERRILEDCEDSTHFSKYYLTFLNNILNLDKHQAKSFAKKRFDYFRGCVGQFKTTVSHCGMLLYIDFTNNNKGRNNKVMLDITKQIELFKSYKQKQDKYTPKQFVKNESRKMTRIITNFTGEMLEFLNKQTNSVSKES